MGDGSMEGWTAGLGDGCRLLPVAGEGEVGGRKVVS